MRARGTLRAVLRLGTLAGALFWLLVVWGGFGGALLTATQRGGGAGLDLDFYTFLDSSEQLLRGAPLYTAIRDVTKAGGAQAAPLNLNHPALAVLLVPFTALDRYTAFLVWTALNLAAYLLAAGLALRALGGRRDPLALVACFALILTLPGALYSLELGELGLLLALPVAGVWTLLRRDRAIAAGLLLGALIALKSFLFLLVPLFLLRRYRRGLPAIAAGAAGLSLLALPFAGPGAFRDWLATMRGITWYAQNTNLSLTGLLYRALGLGTEIGTPLALALTWGPPILAGVLALLVVRRLGAGPFALDRAFALLLALAILGSPLGWLYYLPLLVPGFALAYRLRGSLPPAARAALLASLLLLWMPHAFLPRAGASLAGQLLLGAAPTYGLILLALGLALLPIAPAEGPVRAAPVATTEERALPTLHPGLPAD